MHLYLLIAYNKHHKVSLKGCRWQLEFSLLKSAPELLNLIGFYIIYYLTNILLNPSERFSLRELIPPLFKFTQLLQDPIHCFLQGCSHSNSYPSNMQITLITIMEVSEKYTSLLWSDLKYLDNFHFSRLSANVRNNSKRPQKHVYHCYFSGNWTLDYSHIKPCANNFIFLLPFPLSYELFERSLLCKWSNKGV